MHGQVAVIEGQIATPMIPSLAAEGEQPLVDETHATGGDAASFGDATIDIQVDWEVTSDKWAETTGNIHKYVTSAQQAGRRSWESHL